MSRRSTPRKPSDIVRARVRELRTERGWSAQQLADLLHEYDPDTALNRDVLANFENGRRPTVSIDEVMLLAYVLDESPIALLVPDPDGPSVAVTPDVEVPPLTLHSWLVRGSYLLPGQDDGGGLTWRLALANEEPPDPDIVDRAIGALMQLVTELNHWQGHAKSRERKGREA